MIRQFTATVYILYQEKVLLHKHPKLGKWLPPGGHLEPDETPPEAARREVKEETGLDIALLEQENFKMEAYNAVSFERPFFCLLENIPETPKQPAHQHMDMIYLGVPTDESQLERIAPEFKWFSFEDLEKIEDELFPDTQQFLTLLFKEGLYQQLFTTVKFFYQRL
jgi:8-oxo-dGTP pyrophosphatase MutT (NUDIX family)